MGDRAAQVDAIMHYKGADQLLSVKALNEFDPKCVSQQSRLPLNI